MVYLCVSWNNCKTVYFDDQKTTEQITNIVENTFKPVFTTSHGIIVY